MIDHFPASGGVFFGILIPGWGTILVMIDIESPVGRRELIRILQDHNIHIARLSGALSPELPSQVAGSNLLSAAVQTLQVARKFAIHPSDDKVEVIIDLLESQFAWLDLLASAELAQPNIIKPHLDRILDLLEDAFKSSP
jgi:hypothetical protein